MKKFMCWILLLLLAVPALALGTQGTTQVTGIAFFDADGNGMLDEGERTLSDVEVSLVSPAGGAESVIGVVRTQGDGTFSFAQVAAGTYHIKALVPDGFFFSPMADGGSAMLPASGQSSLSREFTLNDGQSAHLPIGLIRQPSYITVYAFGDLNGNGGRMSNEPLLRNVQLELLYDAPDGTTFVVGTAATNKDGIATIRDLTPGTYRLRATLPEPYVVGPLGTKINTFYNTLQPGEGNTGTSAPFEVPFRGSAGLGIGGVETGQINGSVWQDTNMNGLREAGEPGFAGATVTITHTALGVTHDTVSAADGSYAFINLQEGDYLLSVTLPEGSMFTLPGDSLFSDGYTLTGSTAVNVVIRETSTVQAVGIMPATSLVVSAFHDQNVNGVKDEGEPMFAGANVAITAGGRQVAQAATDADGIAHFPLLRGGSLTVRMTLPDGQVFSVDGGENGNRFVSLSAKQDLTAEYTLAHGTEGSLAAGATLPASIAGVLYDDVNMDSRRDAGEAPLAGFAVQAVNAQGEVAAETVTDDNGAYTLSALIPGTYRVRVPLIAPFIFSQATSETAGNRFVDQTPAHGETAEIALTAAQAFTGADGALFRSAVVEGNVLLGDQADNFAGTLGGLSGVRVVLLNEDGTEVSEYTHAVTDDAGAFLLKGALPGAYKLSYVLPGKALFSSPYLDETTYITEVFTLDAGAVLQADDVFAVRTGSVSGTVYADANDNGELDDADTLYEGAAITLTNDEMGWNHDAVSAADGTYLMENLRPGSYTMDIVLDDTMLIAFGKTSPATPALSATATADIAVAMGEDLPGRDIAAVPARALSGRAFYDNDLSRTDSDGDTASAGLEIRLRHALSKLEFVGVTDENGGFTLTRVFPGAYTMTLSLPADHELYAPQGARQDGTSWTAQVVLAADQGAVPLELGLVQFGTLSGQIWNMGGTMEDVGRLPVHLYREGEPTPIASASSDQSGSYRFDRLYPGEYHIGVILPEGYCFARTLDTAERVSLITSDATPVSGISGQSNAFTLSMGEQKAAQDIGMGKMGQLGDFAWLDLDGDGMQDMGEPGVPGITIRLYQHGQLAAETETDPYGRYLFPELHPGTYTLQAAMPPELTATKQQTEFPLVGSILPQAEGTNAVAEGVKVPSGARNLNADLGFALRDGKTLPASMQQLPQKDWTPYSNVTPTR